MKIGVKSEHCVVQIEGTTRDATAQIAYTERSTRWTYPSSWYSFERDLGGGASLEAVIRAANARGPGGAPSPPGLEIA